MNRPPKSPRQPAANVDANRTTSLSGGTGVPLPAAFFRQPAEVLAPDLVGRFRRRGPMCLRITEVEAYLYPGDTASHACRGPTPRNRVMWGPPGHAYVYLCYGLHQMLNIVSNEDGHPGAVLVRACEPVAGVERLAEQWPGRAFKDLLCGPGRVARALGVDRTFNGHPLFESGGLELLSGTPATRLLRGPRVGIAYAAAKDQKAPLRFADADSAFVTVPRSLRPMRRPAKRVHSKFGAGRKPK